VGKPEEKRPRYRCKNNIKMGVQELEWGMDWIALAQDKKMWRTPVNAVMNFGFHKVRRTS
jgi:hypothetical protein